MKNIFFRKQKTPSIALLRDTHSHIIGNVFSNDPEKEKQFFKAITLWNDNKAESGLKQLERCEHFCETNDEYFAVTMFKAVCYEKMKCNNQAIAAYEKALTFSQNSTAYSNLGTCYLNKGMFDKALEHYLHAIDLNPENPYPYNNIAQLYVQQGEYTLALEYAEKAIKIKNNLQQAWSAKAICFAMLDDYNAYKNAYQRAVAVGYDGETIKKYINSLKNNDFDE